MAIWDRNDNWLAGIHASDHPNHSIRGNLGDLTAEMVQKTFDITYGKGYYKARNHGSVITVWHELGYVAQIRNYAQRARDRGDEIRASELDLKADSTLANVGKAQEENDGH